MPVVSVGVPVFNGERYLEDAVRSILAQTGVDLELIISDNASTDRTPELCRLYAASDRRIRYVRNDSNQGAAANYNRLVRLAEGEYFKWAAHDDILEPTFLRDCLTALQRDRQAVLSFPHAVVIDENGHEVGPEIMDEVVVRAGSAHERLREYFASSWDNPRCTAILGVVRTEVLRRTRLIGRYVSADRVLLAELAMQGRFVRVPGVLLKRRKHEGSSMRAQVSVDARMRWFDTSYRGTLRSPHLLWLWKYLTAIPAARFSPMESVRCLLAMRDYMKRVRPRVMRELRGRTGVRT